MPDLTVPDEFDEWPFDVRRFVLAEANRTIDLREEIDSLTGLPSEWDDSVEAARFDKAELAALVMALGGPQEDGHG